MPGAVDALCVFSSVLHHTLISRTSNGRRLSQSGTPEKTFAIDPDSLGKQHPGLTTLRDGSLCGAEMIHVL